MSDAVIVGLIAGFSSIIGITIAALINYKANKRIKTEISSVHMLINSRMTEMLENIRALGKAEGKAQEIADSKQRNK